MKLIIEDDEGRKTVVPLVREDVEITIGRQEGNTIRLTERNVSRRHAKLCRKNGTVSVEDLGSYNGVKVNGDRIQGVYQIKEGDLVQIGDYDLAVQSEEQKHEQKHAPSAATAPLPQVSDEAATIQSEVPEGEDAAPPAPAKKHDSTSVISGHAVRSARPARKIVDIPAESAPRLLLTTTELSGREYACIRSELKIGRTDDNDIAIDHRSISRNHCKVVREDNGEWKVLDLQSANGVKVNGEVYAESALKPGDILELGHLRFKFLAAGEEASSTPETTSLDGAKRAKGGNSKIALIAGIAAAVLVVGGGATWYFVLRKPAVVAANPPKPEDPKPTDTKLAEPKATDPKPTPETKPETKPAPDPKAADPKGEELPVPAALPTAIDQKLAKTFEKGQELFKQGKFADAEKRFARCKDYMVEGAAEWLEKTRAEMEHERMLGEAQKKFTASDLAGARQHVESIPDESFFGAKAKALKGQIAAAEEKRARAEEAAQAKLKEQQEKQAKNAAGKASQVTEVHQQGLALLKERKYKEAIGFFQKAVELDPTFAEGHLYLGISFANSGDSRKGAWHYEEFVHLAPDHKSAPQAIEILRQFFAGSPGVKPRYPLP